MRKSKPFRLKVSGENACFTRPEMKVERVSYDVMTPSAARGILEAILWKPAIRWKILQIDVLNPIKWESVRRNEVGAVIPAGSVKSTMKKGEGILGLYVEKERQQRAGLQDRRLDGLPRGVSEGPPGAVGTDCDDGDYRAGRQRGRHQLRHVGPTRPRAGYGLRRRRHANGGRRSPPGRSDHLRPKPLKHHRRPGQLYDRV